MASQPLPPLGLAEPGGIDRVCGRRGRRSGSSWDGAQVTVWAWLSPSLHGKGPGSGLWDVPRPGVLLPAAACLSGLLILEAGVQAGDLCLQDSYPEVPLPSAKWTLRTSSSLSSQESCSLSSGAAHTSLLMLLVLPWNALGRRLLMLPEGCVKGRARLIITMATSASPVLPSPRESSFLKPASG